MPSWQRIPLASSAAMGIMLTSGQDRMFPLYSDLVWHNWSTGREMDKLKWVQWRATKMIENSDTGGKAESSGTVNPGVEKFHREILSLYKYLRLNRWWSQMPFSWAQWKNKRTQYEAQEIQFEKKKKIISMRVAQDEQDAQRILFLDMQHVWKWSWATYCNWSCSGITES